MDSLVYLLVGINVALVAGLTLYVLARRRDPAVMLAWILSFFLLPYLAAIVFIFFGLRRFRRRRRPKPHPVAQGPGRRAEDPGLAVPEDVRSEVRNVARLSEALTGFPVTADNDVQVWVDPRESYDALANAIEQAKHHIHLEVYILRDDGVGRRFRDLLIAAAQRGVQCRLLVDAVGSLRLPGRFMPTLRRAGVHAAFFSHWRLFPRLWHLHLRNHRKLAVIDGKIGFIGSQNLLDNFGGRASSDLAWHDAHARIEGAAAAQLQSIFTEDWRFATQEVLQGTEYFPEAESPGELQVQMLPTGADLPESTLNLIFQALLHTAQQRITIVTPYLVPSGAMGLALEGAARRGVHVTVILPGHSDNWLARWAGKSWYADLIEAGVRIFEHPSGVVHAKVTVIDDHLTLLGSANMDIRSFQLNFEAGTFIYGTRPASDLQARADAMVRLSHEVTPRTLRHTPRTYRIVEGACRLLSPLL